MRKAALVLEGGAFRGVYTSGVLDGMMEDGLDFECVIGVSAGALNGVGYVAGQKEFSRNVNIGYRHDPNYVGIRAISKERSIIGFDYLFNDISKNKVPLDFEAFKNSPKRFIAVATCVEDGLPHYFEKSETEDMLQAVRASSTIPLVCKRVTIGNNHYFDGGVTDPVAFQHAFDLGYEKVVIVLTNPISNISSISKLTMHTLERIFHREKVFLKSLQNMDNAYNTERKLLAKLVEEGKVVIIAPKQKQFIKQLEKDTKKLIEFYEMGYQDYQANKEMVLAYLNREE